MMLSGHYVLQHKTRYATCVTSTWYLGTYHVSTWYYSITETGCEGVTRTWDSTLVKSPEDKAGLKLAFRWTADFSTDFHQQVTLYALTWGRKVKLVLDENADVVLTHHFVGGFWMTYWEYKNKPFTNYDFLGQKLVHFSIKPRSCVLCIFIPQFGKCESE